MAKKQNPRQRLRARIGTTRPTSLTTDIGRLYRLAMSGPRAPKAPVIDAEKFGATGADLQYGEVIRELTRSVENADRQGDQNLADLGNWFGSAKASYETSAANNQRSGAAARAAQAAADAGIAASLGGGASAAAAALAQSAGSNQAFLGGLTAAGEQADQRNIAQVEAEKAGALVKQKRIDDAREIELRNELGDKRFLRGRAAYEGELEARNINWQRQMQGFEAAAGAQGQKFSQLSSLPALKISAMMAGTQLTGAETDILNALEYPTGGSGGGGGGTPRLPNGMTPGEYARLILARDKAAIARDDKTTAEVRARRSKYFDDLTSALSGTHKVQDPDTGKVEFKRNIQGARNAMNKAVVLARARGLELRKPAVQQLIMDAVLSSVGGADPELYARLLAGYLPAGARRKPPKPKPLNQRRRSGV